jgi:hypothetical protein
MMNNHDRHLPSSEDPRQEGARAGSTPVQDPQQPLSWLPLPRPPTQASNNSSPTESIPYPLPQSSSHDGNHCNSDSNSSHQSDLPARGSGNSYHHNRKVSWASDAATQQDGGGSIAAIPPPMQLLVAQQQQQQETSMMQPSRNNGNNNNNTSFLEHLHRSSAMTSSTRFLSLNDLLGSAPMELEAETRVLQAVERLGVHHHHERAISTLTNDASITNDDDNSNKYQQEGDEASNLYEAIAADDIMARTAASREESSDSDEHGDEDYDEFAWEQGNETILSPLGFTSPVGAAATARNDTTVVVPPQQQQETTAPSNSNNALPPKPKAGSARTKFRSIVRLQMATKSVEEALFGLANQLNQMSQEEERKEHDRTSSSVNANAMVSTRSGASTRTINGGDMRTGKLADGAASIVHQTSRGEEVVTAGMQSDTEAMDSSSDDEEKDAAKNPLSLLNSNTKNKKSKKKRKSRKSFLTNGLKEDFSIVSRICIHWSR